MNLKYFKNNEGDYIIYRHSNCQYLDNYLYLQTIYTTFSLLPYDSTNLETFFDKQIPIILDLELHKLHLDINDILNIQILANYQNLDISNPIFTNNILDLNSIDNTNNFFKFTFKNNFFLPLNKKTFFKNPGLFIKSAKNSLFTN